MRHTWRRWRYYIVHANDSHAISIIALVVVMMLMLGIVIITHDSLVVCLSLIIPVLLLSWVFGWWAGLVAGSCAALITAPYHHHAPFINPPLDSTIWIYLSLCYLILGLLFGIQGAIVRSQQKKLYAEFQAKLNQAQASSKHYEQLIEEMNHGQERLNRMNSELALLNTIATTVNSSLDLYQVQTTAMAQISALLDVDEMHFYWLNPNGEGFILQASTPVLKTSDHLEPVSMHDGILGRVAQRLQAEYIGVETGELHLRPAVMSAECQSIMAIPLHSRSRLVGALVLGKNTERGFSMDDGRFLESVGRILAIAVENATLFRQTQALSMSDDLTGLANRRFLNHRLQVEVARVGSTKEPLCLAILDLDFFKRINDQYGHPAGDEVLRLFAKRVQQEIRSTDLFCRLGGEEFALIATNSTLTATAVILERICRCIANTPFELSDGQQVSITVSAGIAHLQPGIETSEALACAADQALYNAKADGRNRVMTYARKAAIAEVC